MICYVVRHGDKERGDFYSARLRHQDQPLSARGLEQAARLCAALADKPITAIYASAYQRTGQTIAALADARGLVPVIDERLNEIDNGAIDALPDTEVQRLYPDVWAAYKARQSDFRFPEGETGEEVRQRIASLLDDLLARHADEHVLLATHEGWMRLLLCQILGLPVNKRWQSYVDLCGLVEMTYEPDYGTWKLLRFNQTFP
ncbi:MAG: histidine phosphatase family protein [Chloroflexi bacterium]|nr:histidine phosphatase family protein [Chloroflexota bacterium]